MKTAVLCASVIALALAGCGGDLLRRDVIAQARADGEIAFDVVKIDEPMLTALLAQPQPPFHERFKKYLPPPEPKIAVGDTVSVVIWESAANGLFGNSLTELSFPAGAAARLLAGLTAAPPGMTVSPGLPAMLFGGSAGQGATGTAAQAGLAGGPQSTAGTGPPPTGTLPGAERTPGMAAGALSPRLEQFINLATQAGRPGTLIPDQPVGPDGAISVPYAGRIAVAGRTPQEVQRALEEVLGPRALDPQALVIVKRSAANSVSVAGEAITGARIPLSPGGDRLLQVIAAAGGGKAPVHESFVRLSRAGVTATVPLATLVADPDQDIFAEPGDVLTVVRRPQTFSVFGAAGKNAAITFTQDRLSLSEALAKAGGLLDARADPRAVFVFRHEPVSVVGALGQPVATGARDGLSPIVYRLDLNEAKSYLLAQRFPVHDKDVIFVANAESQPLYRFFQALSRVTGPVGQALLTCTYVKC